MTSTKPPDIPAPPEKDVQPSSAMTYKVAVKTTDDIDWVFNGLVFAKERDADDYRMELFSKWTALVDAKVFRSYEYPNVRWQDGRLIFIENEDIKIDIKGEDDDSI